MVADMEVDMVADMEVEKVADMELDMVANMEVDRWPTWCRSCLMQSVLFKSCIFLRCA